MVRAITGKFGKLFAIFVLALIAVCCMSIINVSADYSTNDIAKAIGDVIEYKQAEGDNMTQEDSWFCLSLAQLGYSGYEEYKQVIEEYVTYMYAENSGLDSVKATEWHRIILAYSAVGGNPADCKGINLVADGIYNRESVDEQGLNGTIWGIIAGVGTQTDIPKDSKLLIDILAEDLKSAQLENGGFSLNGNSADTDITCMAITALAMVGDSDKEIAKALDYVKAQQSADGSFISGTDENLESTAQAIIALCTAGLSPDYLFGDCVNAVDALLFYQNADGGFSHLKGGESDGMATQQALQALVSIMRFYNGFDGLYCVSDIPKTNLLEGAKSELYTTINKYDQLALDDISNSPNTDNILILEYLTKRYEMAGNQEDYADYGQILAQLLDSVYSTNEKIGEINLQIRDEIYPVDDCGVFDYFTIKSILDKAKNLNSVDKAKVLCIDEMQEKIVQIRLIIITVIVGSVMIILAGVIIIRKRILKGRGKIA